jgi:hypothetical protein
MARRALNESVTPTPYMRQSRRPLGDIENNRARQRLPIARDCSKVQSTTICPDRRRQARKAGLPARPRVSTKSESEKRRASTVACTNPLRTKALWEEVMSATRSTKSSEGKRIQGLGGVVGRGRGRGTGTGSPQPRTASSTAASESGSQSQTTRSVFAKPSDNDFYELVLLPRGIVIYGQTPSMLAAKHFSTTIPPSEQRTYYQQASGGAESRVWLEKEESFVTDVLGEYGWMTSHRSSEAEFAAYGKEMLIRRETRHTPKYQPSEQRRAWMTHRMVELVTKPQTVNVTKAPVRNPSPWWTPPLLDLAQPHREYSYDIRPDCQYWLSLNFANPEYRRLYRDFVFENSGESVCPYFTVEFKKDKGSDETATNQLATAAALALHNRCILKHRYLQASKQEHGWAHPDTQQQIRHYGLTFAGSEYQFWCIQPDVSEQDINTSWIWRGCTMENVSRGTLQGEVEVEDFIDWVNEIHRWGLTVYGRACEADVKGCIDHGPSGIRTSSAATLAGGMLGGA